MPVCHTVSAPGLWSSCSSSPHIVSGKDLCFQPLLLLVVVIIYIYLIRSAGINILNI